MPYPSDPRRHTSNILLHSIVGGASALAGGARSLLKRTHSQLINPQWYKSRREELEAYRAAGRRPPWYPKDQMSTHTRIPYSALRKPSGRYAERRYRKMPFSRSRYHKNAKRVVMKDASFYKHGSVFTQQNNYTTTNNEIALVGHGFGPACIMQNVFEALVLLVFRKAGYTVKSAMDRIAGEVATAHAVSHGDVKIYHKDDNGLMVRDDFAIGLNQTFSELANTITIYYLANMTPVAGAYTTETTWHRLELVHSGVNSPAATIDLTNLILDMKLSSVLRMQNRTKAAKEAGDTSVDVDYSVDDIYNNPVVGRSYIFNGSGGKWRVARGDGSHRSQVVVLGQKGVVDPSAYPGTLLNNQTYHLQLTRPPMPNMFQNLIASKRVSLDPGEIKTARITYAKTMTFQRFYTRILDFAQRVALGANRDNAIFNNLGRSQFFAFERKITVGTEPNVTIGCEVSQVFKCKAYFRKPRILSYQNVVSGTL